MSERPIIQRYDRDLKPIGFARWCVLFEDASYSTLHTTAVGGFWVVTRWIGMDVMADVQRELSGGRGLPQVFETIIWPRHELSVFERMFGVERFRSATEDAALAAHYAEGIPWAFAMSEPFGLVPMLTAGEAQ